MVLELFLQFTIFLLVLSHLLLLFLSTALYLLKILLVALRHPSHPRHHSNIEFIGLVVPLWILFNIGQAFLNFNWGLSVNSICPTILLIIGISTHDIRHPQPLPKLFGIPPEALNGFLLPLIILRVLISHIRFELIPLPTRLVVADTPRPHFQIELVTQRLMPDNLRRIVWYWSCIIGEGIIIDGTVDGWSLAWLLLVKTMLILILTETHNNCNYNDHCYLGFFDVIYYSCYTCLLSLIMSAIVWQKENKSQMERHSPIANNKMLKNQKGMQ